MTSENFITLNARAPVISMYRVSVREGFLLQRMELVKAKNVSDYYFFFIHLKDLGVKKVTNKM